MKNRIFPELKKADYILAGVLFAAGLLLFGLWFLTRSGGAKAVVYRDGTKIASYPLTEDREIRLETPDGGFNLLVIKDGKASVSEASCPDKLCTNMHAIRYAGESIICLPNRMVVRIEGGKASGVDI